MKPNGGISIQEKELNPEISHDTTIFRPLNSTSLPVGKIEEIEVALHEERLISEVVLKIEGKSIILRSGEVYELESGFNLVWLDESILIKTIDLEPTSEEKQLLDTVGGAFCSFVLNPRSI